MRDAFVEVVQKVLERVFLIARLLIHLNFGVGPLFLKGQGHCHSRTLRKKIRDQVSAAAKKDG